ncbi:MAG: DoxX family protein [Schlesneria sp.]|nr:DoxX family protein [Schlesneria sp.]
MAVSLTEDTATPKTVSPWHPNHAAISISIATIDFRLNCDPTESIAFRGRIFMAAKVGKLVWTGRILSLLASALFIMSAAMKLLAPKEIEKGMGPLQLPTSLILPLGILELACVAIYLFPPTAILGAILLTGYIGGAILAHLRVGEPVYVQAILGVVVWLGIFLREERLRKLIPIRR